LARSRSNARRSRAAEPAASVGMAGASVMSCTVPRRITAHVDRRFSEAIHLRQMAKTLITTPFPTTEEVARILGLSQARVRQIEALMDRAAAEDTERRSRAAKKAWKRRRAESARRANANR
jgi:hypothetical protein